MKDLTTASSRLTDSILLKLVFITILTLMLLIPSSWIQSLIQERSARQTEIISDVSDKWSGSQLVQGPVLMIPYKKSVKETNSKNKTTVKEYRENLYLLPENLQIKAAVHSKTLHRGMFDVAVYDAGVQLNGHFNKADIAKLQIDDSMMQLDKARLIFGISDLKGLKSNPVIRVQNQELTAEPALNSGTLLDNGLQVNVNLTGSKTPNIPFTFKLDIKGSQELNFIHTGKTTEVAVSGNWPSPSFDGRYLPDDRHVDAKGFRAKWRMVYYNRPFPQQWAGDDKLLNALKQHTDAIFGVKLLFQADQYQQTMRTSKYAILVIILTFVSLFLTEVIQKQRVHVFNYGLIGAAMVIFYTLLLSFSEQIGYNLAYLIAAAATIALITWFVSSLLQNAKAAYLFGGLLSLFYGFIYVIIQLEDLSLMVGSIALFIVITALMYFSRKINWDRPMQQDDSDIEAA